MSAFITDQGDTLITDMFDALAIGFSLLLVLAPCSVVTDTGDTLILG